MGQVMERNAYSPPESRRVSRANTPRARAGTLRGAAGRPTRQQRKKPGHERPPPVVAAERDVQSAGLPLDSVNLRPWAHLG
jgi:hypothetical protein